MLKHTCAVGTELYTKFQRVYAPGYSLGDGVVESDTAQTADPTMLTGGVAIEASLLTSYGASLDAGAPLLDASLLLGDGIIMGDRVVMGDGIVMSDGIIMGDGILMGDSLGGG